MLETYRSTRGLETGQPSALSRSVDILWRDSATGAALTWTMQGASPIGSAAFETVDPNWKVAATTDVDQNGQVNILWRNTTTGQNVWWFTKNDQLIGYQWLPTISDQTWEIAGVGDLNQDGQTDILWRNQVSGLDAWWYMRDGNISGTAWLPTIDASWSIVTVGDFNHDRQIDLLWRDNHSGRTAWWLMQSTAIQQTVDLPPNDPAITLVEAADFNQDGNLDLLWHDTRSGANSLWTMEGATVLERYDLPQMSSSWIMAGVLPRLASPDPAGGNALTTATPESSARIFQSQQVSTSQPNDFYRFTVMQSGVFTGHITGLTGDADLKLIQDRNSNGTIDSGEILAWQWERGTVSESVRRFITAGTYYVQVTSYDRQTAAYSLSTNFIPAAFDDQQFHLNLVYGNGTSGLTDNAKAAMGDAAHYWENVITNRSAITQFQDLTITIVGQALSNSNVLADAGPNPVSDGTSLFIQSGTATINTNRLAELNSDPTYLTEIMIHEFAHVLGFGTLWEPIDFRSGNNILTVGRRYIDRSNATYNADTYAGWAYGDLLGTDQPTAVPIDPGSFSHWSEATFTSELMTPYAESIGAAMPTSQLTIAALRDLGWNVNYGAADPYALPNPIVLPNPTLVVT